MNRAHDRGNRRSWPASHAVHSAHVVEAARLQYRAPTSNAEGIARTARIAAAGSTSGTGLAHTPLPPPRHEARRR